MAGDIRTWLIIPFGTMEIKFYTSWQKGWSFCSEYFYLKVYMQQQIIHLHSFVPFLLEFDLFLY